MYPIQNDIHQQRNLCSSLRLLCFFAANALTNNATKPKGSSGMGDSPMDGAPRRKNSQHMGESPMPPNPRIRPPT